MPSKNIAGILNNESNLHILEKLKERPYYPRELAAEMKLSEPFVVRRLKAMEEHEIVEGKWETVNNRKVKRYYLKDVTMQLGKDGLKVTSSELPVKSQIDIKKEAIAYLIKLPVTLIVLFGIFFNVPIIIAAICLYFAWSEANNVAFYRAYRMKSVILSMVLSIFCIAILGFILVKGLGYIDLGLIPSPAISAIFITVLIIVMVYRSRFYQIEIDDLIRYKRDLVSSLDQAPVHVKIFYLPMVSRWKLSEYFGLV